MQSPIEGNVFHWKGVVCHKDNTFKSDEVIFTIADDFSYIKCNRQDIPLVALRDLMQVIAREYKNPMPAISEQLDLIRFGNMNSTTASLPIGKL